MEPDWTREERIPLRRMLTIADWFTLFNAFFGFAAIALSARGDYEHAFMLIVLGVILDGVDGGLARLGYGGGRLGSKLDSLGDLVTFCVAPAFLFWSAMGARSIVPGSETSSFASTALVLAACVVYFLFGILRLARFDYLKGGERHDYFIGVTTPGGAIVLASLALLGWDLAPSLFLVFITSFLMTSRVRLPKVRGALAPSAVLVLSAALLTTSLSTTIGPVILLVCFLFYLLLGPGYVRRHAEADDAGVPL